MYSDNDRFRKYLNVEEWHKQGYTGRNVKVSTGETVWKRHFPEHNVIEYPFGDRIGNEHAILTARAFFEIAPNATLYSINSALDKENFTRSLQVIKDNNIILNFSSVSTKNGNEYNNWDKELEKLPFHTHFMSYGNGGPTGDNSSGVMYDNKQTYCEHIYSVGACKLMADNELVLEGYSSRGEHLDFMSVAGLYIPDRFIGTSCSCPVLVGMCALVQDFFIQKTGKALSSKMMYQFVKDHCKDLEIKGKDINTGWGIFILPNPQDIDINKYKEGDILDNFKDKDKIADWAKDSVRYCVEKGLLQGKGENFEPKASLTREEMAVIIKRIVEFKG